MDGIRRRSRRRLKCGDEAVGQVDVSLFNKILPILLLQEMNFCWLTNMLMTGGELKEIPGNVRDLGSNM